MPAVKGRSGGRNAKTVEQLKREGTYDASRHAGIENPEPPPGQPTAPKTLAGDALDEWNRMLWRLELSKTLAIVDDAALYQYCLLFAETDAIARVQAETAGSIDRLEENLSGLEGADLVQCFQEITKLRQLEARYTTQVRQGRMALRTYLVEFGLTPAARSRVKVITKKDEQDSNPLAAIQRQAHGLRRVQ